MLVTQTEIDNAVILGKSAVAKLASELALERKYGGNIDCCLCTLGVLWGWVQVLSCQREVVEDSEEVLAIGYIKFDTAVVQNVINIFVDGVNISGDVTLGSTNVVTAMTAVANAINDHQDVYVAEYNSDAGLIILTGTCENEIISFTATGGLSASRLTITQFFGGKCPYSSEGNCLSVEDTKELIGKINSLCSN